MRLAACTLLALAAVIAGGCDRRPAGTAATDPDPAFVRRCEALPPATIEVVAVPVRTSVDDSRSLKELTGMYDRARAGHQTMGLTQTRIGYQTSVSLNGLKDGSGRHTCTRATIHVALTMQPMIVYIARELANDPCRTSAVRSHEELHVAVYEAHLRDNAARLATELHAASVLRMQLATSVADAEARLADELARVLDAFLARQGELLREQQAAVDSPAEYARVAAACP